MNSTVTKSTVGPKPEWTWETLSLLIDWYEKKGEAFVTTLPPARRKFGVRYSDAGENTELHLMLPIPRKEHARGRLPPLLLWFHGGYWQAGSAKESIYLAEDLVNAGVAMATVDYDLAPKVSVDKIVEQAVAACAFCWRNASRFGFDRNRIVVAGHSCGGHLCAEVLATNFSLISGDLPLCPIAGLVSFSGVFDLQQHMLSPTTAQLISHDLNAATSLDKDSARRLSPCLKVPMKSVPVLLFVGELEEPEFHRDHAALTSAWSPHLPLETLTIEKTDHFTCLETLAAAAPSAVRKRVLTLCHDGT